MEWRLQQTFSVNDIYPQNTKFLFTQPNTFHLLVLILVCECVFTMDAFREAFNMLMILSECKGNYRAPELMYNECYLNHPNLVWHFVVWKTDFFNMKMVESDLKDVNRQQLLMKKNQQMLLLIWQ